jgi:flavin-dependent dehydrogenase
MEPEYDVVIVGAGLAGISAAKTLQERGWRTLCCDRRSFPRHKVCGEFLSPEAKRTLGELGLLECVERLRPRPIEHAEIDVGSGMPMRFPLEDVAYGISRYRLDAALHEAAESVGVRIAVRTLVTNIRRIADGYAIECRHEGERRSVTARAVIAAWGGQLVTRERPQAASHVSPTYIGLKSHYMNIEPGNAVELYGVPGGYVGIAPVDDGLANVAALIRSDQVKDGDSVHEKLRAAARANRRLQARLEAAVPVPGSQASVHPVVLDRRPRLWEEAGEYPLVGDAALMIPPLCGDGMSMALYTALRCARETDRYLKGEISLDQWRHAYERTVKRAVSGPLWWGRLAHRWIGTPALSRGIAPVLRRWSGLSGRIVRWTRLHI